jgi:hypothetical protein
MLSGQTRQLLRCNSRCPSRMSVPVQPYIRSQRLHSAAAKQQHGLLQAGDELDDSFTGLDVSSTLIRCCMSTQHRHISSNSTDIVQSKQRQHTCARCLHSKEQGRKLISSTVKYTVGIVVKPATVARLIPCALLPAGRLWADDCGWLWQLTVRCAVVN